MISYTKKDVVTTTKGIILHQTNCMGAMNNGVAKAIREKWPIVFEKYSEYVNSFGDQKWRLLGKAYRVRIDEHLSVYNLFGQYDFGYDNSRRTEYSALNNAMSIVISDVEFDYEMEGNDILIPDLIGCGVAKGDKTIVMEIIKHNFERYKGNVLICSIQ